MAEPSSNIFNQRAAERLRSPDDLDKFLRMTNPSVWTVLAACIALMVGLFIWGFFGTIAPNVKAYGVCQEGRVLGMVSPDNVEKIRVGDEALVDGVPLTVTAVSREPLSRDEAKSMVGGDYLVSKLMEEDWAYVVDFEGDASQLSEGVPLEVVITVENIAPITLVLGGGR